MQRELLVVASTPSPWQWHAKKELDSSILLVDCSCSIRPLGKQLALSPLGANSRNFQMDICTNLHQPAGRLCTWRSRLGPAWTWIYQDTSFLFSFSFSTTRRVHGSIRGKITGVQRDLQVGEVSPGASITTHYTLARDSALTRGKGLDIRSASTDFPRDRVC